MSSIASQLPTLGGAPDCDPIVDQLNNLNLEDSPITVVFITGPPGSGKSTVARQVAIASRCRVKNVDTDHGWGTMNLMTGAGNERNTISAGECGTWILEGNHLIISCGNFFVPYLKTQLTKFFPENQFSFVVIIPKIDDMSHDASWTELMTNPVIINRLSEDKNRESTPAYLEIMRTVGANGLKGLPKAIFACDKFAYWNPLAPVSESAQQIVEVFADAKAFVLPTKAMTLQLREVFRIDNVMYHITIRYNNAGTLPVTLDDINRQFATMNGYIIDYQVEASKTEGSIVVIDDAGSHITMNPKNGIPPKNSQDIALAAIADKRTVTITVANKPVVICNITKRTDANGDVITKTYTPIGRSFSHGDY
jgi:energy-coupling factor transporter ATP-binding protein EcfA2